jgi:hypothetical protein
MSNYAEAVFLDRGFLTTRDSLEPNLDRTCRGFFSGRNGEKSVVFVGELPPAFKKKSKRKTINFSLKAN